MRQKCYINASLMLHSCVPWKFKIHHTERRNWPVHYFFWMETLWNTQATAGRAEEVTVYADAICALHKLDDDHFREATKMIEFTEDDAKAWTASMENEDGTTGPHWTMGQTDACSIANSEFTFYCGNICPSGRSKCSDVVNDYFVLLVVLIIHSIKKLSEK